MIKSSAIMEWVKVIALIVMNILGYNLVRLAFSDLRMYSSFIYMIEASILLFTIATLLDLIFAPEWRLNEELKRGNVAVAIWFAGICIAVAIAGIAGAGTISLVAPAEPVIEETVPDTGKRYPAILDNGSARLEEWDKGKAEGQ